MHWLTLALLALPVAYLVQKSLQLYRNYLLVRKTGFQYLICPVDTVSPVWIIVGPIFLKQLERHLPDWLWQPIRFTIYGWEFRSGYEPHERYGPVFMMATAGHPELFVADPDVAHDILKRPNDFIMSDAGQLILGKFGDNLLLAQGKTWERMRRFIAPLINERISATVFQETKAQAEQMIRHLESVKGATNDAAEGLKQIAVNVLGAAGYGKPRAWSTGDDEEKPSPGFHVTYVQAVRYLMDNLIEMAFVPTRILLLPFMPHRLNQTAHSIKELTALTRQLLDEERNAPNSAGARANIVKLLVQEQNATEKGTITLQDDEIVGNMFIFSAAGTDTTANTMAYAIFLLAGYPEWQGWIIEEIDEVLAGKTDELEYTDIHPKLIRTLALMYETLRLFAPLTHIARTTTSPKTITTSAGHTHTIPAHCNIYLNSYALQCDPAVWSDSAPPQTFHPPRFLAFEPTTHKPSIKPLRKGSFLAWSAGPRICPGQKMSQVEFVTTFMMLFRRYRVEVALEEGEDVESGLARVRGAMKDSFPRLTMQMNRPEDVTLRFVAR